jgi:hypothetical protein
MNQRPTGVTILAVLAFIGGAFGILGSLALLGLGFAFAGASVGGLSFIFGIVLLALSILELYIGWGFWNLKRSAWSLGLVVFGASLIIQFIEVILGYSAISSFIISLVIYGIVLYYLLTPGVKAAFGVTGDLQSAVMSGLPMGGGAAAAGSAAPPAEPPAAPPPAAPPPAPPASTPPASNWGGSSDASTGGESQADTHDGGDTA